MLLLLFGQAAAAGVTLPGMGHFAPPRVKSPRPVKKLTDQRDIERALRYQMKVHAPEDEEDALAVLMLGWR
jgi:hypothetical protein